MAVAVVLIDVSQAQLLSNNTRPFSLPILTPNLCAVVMPMVLHTVGRRAPIKFGPRPVMSYRRLNYPIYIAGYEGIVCRILNTVPLPHP